MAESLRITAEVGPEKIADYLRRNGIACRVAGEITDAEDAEVTILGVENLYVQVGEGYAVVNRNEGDVIRSWPVRYNASDLLADLRSLLPKNRIS